MRKIVLISAAVLIGLAGCSGPPAQTTRNVQAEAAAVAANSISFTENAEIENIQRRLELTSNPGQIGFITLFNDMGQPIMYASVRGKVTSGGKRLTAPDELRRGTCSNCTMQVEETAWTAGPSDEGTYGSSNPYIFFWTTDGQYIQWSGQYLYSDKPYRLSSPPLVILANGE